MHGRKKNSKIPSVEEIEALNHKTESYNKLSNVLIDLKKSLKHDINSLNLIDRLIVLNPDFYSLWNFRREIILNIYPTINEDIASKELFISSEGIKKNPKSYCAWHHRLWVASVYSINFKEEIGLCDLFLNLDQRNFHCWNYRRAIVKLGNLSIDDELNFSIKKIEENFSNYSALHHRSVYLKDSVEDVFDLLDTELEIIHNAIFTEPDDQSPWWYYQFLMNKASEGSQTDELKKRKYENLLLSELRCIRSLYEIESSSKWVLVTLSYLLESVIKYYHSSGFLIKDETGDISIDDIKKEYILILLTPCDMDKYHKNRYIYLIEKNSNL